MSEQNLKLVQDCYAAFGRGDIQALLSALADDVEWHAPGPPDVPFAGDYKGPAQVGEFFQKLDAAIQFEKFEPRQFIAENGTVVVLGHEKGTVKATGKPEESDWVHVLIVRDGKVASFREFLDTARVAEAFQS